MGLLQNFLDQALLVILLCSGLPLLITAVVGLAIAILQATTQIQEQSVVFLVKLAVFVALTIVGAKHGFGLLSRYFSDSIAAIASLGSLL